MFKFDYVKMMLVVMVVLGIAMLMVASGCGTVHGLCADGRSAFTFLDNATTPLAEKQKDVQLKMEENSQIHQQKRAASLLEYQQRKDKATAEAYDVASSENISSDNDQ